MKESTATSALITSHLLGRGGNGDGKKGWGSKRKGSLDSSGKVLLRSVGSGGGRTAFHVLGALWCMKHISC